MDADEFKRLFLPCLPRLYHIAFRLTRNAQDAQDIVQETFLKMWSRRDRLADIATPLAYATATLRNVYVDMVRQTPREAFSDVGGEELTVASDIDVGQQVEATDSMDIVMGLIDRLPPNQREVIRLRDIADLGYDDIREAIGLTPANIRTLLSRARKKIKEQYLTLLKNEHL